MSYQHFLETLEDQKPAQNLHPLLTAMRYAYQGHWDKAHQIVQHMKGADAAWVHAYLHREEGDQWNAEYWYRRAGRSPSGAPLEREWEEIARSLSDRYY